MFSWENDITSFWNSQLLWLGSLADAAAAQGASRAWHSHAETPEWSYEFKSSLSLIAISVTK